jgi:hypothetical protein
MVAQLVLETLSTRSKVPQLTGRVDHPFYTLEIRAKIYRWISIQTFLVLVTYVDTPLVPMT